MKKKFFMWILVAFFVFPAIALLSACDSAKELGLQVTLNGENFVVNENNTLHLEYKDEISYQAFMLYDNGKTKEVDGVVVTDEDEIADSPLSLGEYSISFKYKNYEEVVINIIVSPKKLKCPTAPASLVYNAQVQTFNLQGFDLNTMLIEGNSAQFVGDYTAVVSLKDTVNYCWEDGNTTELYYRWGIVKKRLAKPVTGIAREYNTDVQNYSIDGFDENTMTISGDLKGTFVDEYSVIISLKDTDNYCWADKTTEDISVVWNIEKCRLEKPVAVQKVYVYNKEEQTFEMIGFDEETMNATGTKQINAGDSYKVEVEIEDKSNYCWKDGTDANVEFNFVIEKCKLEKPVAVEKVYVYNKTEQTFEMTGFDEETMTASGTTQTNAGDAYKVEVELKDKSNYCWKDGTDANVEFNFVIEKCRFEKPVAVQKVYVYNKEEQTFEMIGFDEDTMTAIGTKQINAGDLYEVVININDKSNYCWEDGTDEDVVFSWEIKKAQAVAPSVDALSGIYSPEQILANFDLPENFVWADKTIIPTVLVTSYLAKYNPDSANYLDAEVEIVLNLEKCKINKPVTVQNIYTYNKEEQTFQLTGFDKKTMVVSGNVQTNAGKYKVVSALKDKDNYCWADGTENDIEFTWSIEKFKLTKPAAVQQTYTYNKAEQTFEMTGFDEETMIISGNVQTNAGDHKVTVSIKDKDNYSWADETDSEIEFTWSIAKIKLAKPVAVPKSYTYNKTEQTFEMTGFDEETMAVFGNVQTNAGDHSVKFEIKDFVNYSWTDDSESFNLTWTILKQSVEMLVQEEYIFVWTGQDIEFIPTDFDEQMFDIEYNIQSEVGTHNAVILIKDTINYEWSDKVEGGKNLTFEIVKATPVLSFAEENIDKAYDGKIINVPRLVYSDLYLSEWGANAGFADIAEDITLSYEIKDGDEYRIIQSGEENFANSGYYRVTMVMPETAHFNSVTLTKEFKIYKILNPDDYYVDILEHLINYDGTAKEPEFQVFKRLDFDSELLDPSLYTITYSNNIEVTHNALATISFNDELLVGNIYREFSIWASDILSEIKVEGKTLNNGYFNVDNRKEVNTGTVTLEFTIDEKYLSTDNDEKYFDGEVVVELYEYGLEFGVELTEGKGVCQIPVNSQSVNILINYKGINILETISLKQKVDASTYISTMFHDYLYMNKNIIKVYDKSVLDDLDSIEITFNDDYVLVGKKLSDDKTKLFIEVERRFYTNTNVTIVFDIVDNDEVKNDYSNIKELIVYDIKENPTSYKFVNNKVTINTLTSVELPVLPIPGAAGGCCFWTFSKGSKILVNREEFFDNIRLPISSAGTYTLSLEGDEYFGSGKYTIVVGAVIDAFSIQVNDSSYRLLNRDVNSDRKYGDFYLDNGYEESFFYTFVGAVDKTITNINVSINSFFDCYNLKNEKFTKLNDLALDILIDESGQRYVELIVEIQGIKYNVRLYLIEKPKNGADLVFAIGNKVLSFDCDVNFGTLIPNAVSGDFKYIGYDEDTYYAYFETSVSASQIGQICSQDNNIAGNVFCLQYCEIDVSLSWNKESYENGKICGDFVLEDLSEGFKQIEVTISGHTKLVIKITND